MVVVERAKEIMGLEDCPKKEELGARVHGVSWGKGLSKTIGKINYSYFDSSQELLLAYIQGLILNTAFQQSINSASAKMSVKQWYELK